MFGVRFAFAWQPAMRFKQKLKKMLLFFKYPHTNAPTCTPDNWVAINNMPQKS